MANVFFCSDLHLGHKNIHKFRTDFESEEQHRDVIKENYHKVVTKRDKVFFLGDIAFSQETLEDVGTWTAEKKVLILGNHCHTQGTELLTSKGWKPIEQIGMEDYVGDMGGGNSLYKTSHVLHLWLDGGIISSVYLD